MSNEQAQLLASEYEDLETLENDQDYWEELEEVEAYERELNN